MNKDPIVYPVQCTHCQTRDEVKKTGDYWINRNDPKRPMFMIMLPHDTIPSYLRLYKVRREDGEEDRSWWELTGPDEKPTLTPSLHNPGVWHGHLRDGQLVLA
jgi:hypothetical protein